MAGVVPPVYCSVFEIPTMFDKEDLIERGGNGYERDEAAKSRGKASSRHSLIEIRLNLRC